MINQPMKITYKYEVKSRDKLDGNKLIKILLKNRRIKTIKEFLNPPDPSKLNITDFGFKRELNKTVKLLEKIKKNGQMIVVYTDYDADGITGGAILWETLHLLGFKTMPYVPHRKLEGYGFSQKGIDNVKRQFNPALIISVDHGITARDKVSYAKKLGIPVIITDHHLKPDKLPDDAAAIFHIPALSGSGVAYFFAKAIFTHFASSSTTNYKLLTTYFQCDYLALASIGSIADLVPLLGHTRSLVKYGLDAFLKTKRAGINQIIKQAGIEGKKITPYEVGFIIAPRINAVGRLEHAIDALRLLCTTDHEKAFKLAGKVGDTNRIRQDMVLKAVEQAKNMIENPKTALRNKKLIILFSKDWHEGIIGLIASKITEEYYRPSVVITESNGFLKGSARSITSFHITNFLRGLKKYLIDVGGHKGAAGFTLEKSKFTTFLATAGKVANKQITDKQLERTVEADLKIPLSKIHISLVKELEKLEPFGIGNAKPTFCSEVEIIDKRPFGKLNNHMKLLAKDAETKKSDAGFRMPVEFISFGNAEKYFSLKIGQKIKVVYVPEINRWNGYENLRGKIIYFECFLDL